MVMQLSVTPVCVSLSAHRDGGNVTLAFCATHALGNDVVLVCGNTPTKWAMSEGN